LLNSPAKIIKYFKRIELGNNFAMDINQNAHTNQGWFPRASPDGEKKGTDKARENNLIRTTAWLSQALGDYNCARDSVGSKHNATAREEV
jgi:hypothetical protein